MPDGQGGRVEIIAPTDRIAGAPSRYRRDSVLRAPYGVIVLLTIIGSLVVSPAVADVASRLPRPGGSGASWLWATLALVLLAAAAILASRQWQQDRPGRRRHGDG